MDDEYDEVEPGVFDDEDVLDDEDMLSGSEDSINSDEELTDDEESQSSLEDEQADEEHPSDTPAPLTFTDTLASRPLLTRYELVALLGVRASQLERGAPTALPSDQIAGFDVKRIAQLELQQGKCPLIVVRTLPNGQKFHISASSAILPKM